jgi:hypothetical protein
VFGESEKTPNADAPGVGIAHALGKLSVAWLGFFFVVVYPVEASKRHSDL